MTAVAFAASVHLADKLAMFVVAVGLAVGFALLAAGFAEELRESRASDAGIERDHAPLLEATRQWQGGSAVRRRAAVRPSPAPVAPAAAPVPAHVPAPAVSVAPPAEPAAVVPPPRWPGANPYTSNSSAVAENTPPPAEPAPVDPAPATQPTPEADNRVVGRHTVLPLPADVDIRAKGDELRARLADPDRTELIAPVVSAKGDAR